MRHALWSLLTSKLPAAPSMPARDKELSSSAAELQLSLRSLRFPDQSLSYGSNGFGTAVHRRKRTRGEQGALDGEWTPLIVGWQRDCTEGARWRAVDEELDVNLMVGKVEQV